MNLQAVVQSAGAEREEIAALACVDRSTGLVLSAYTAKTIGPSGPLAATALDHAVVDVPQRPGLVMMGASRVGTRGSLERLLTDLARRIGEHA